MDSGFLIYQPQVKDTYLYLIRENLLLIRKIYKEKDESCEPYNPKRKGKLYCARAKHLQVMSLIGLTAEHLIKIILLKRGYVLNTGEFSAKFTNKFMKEVDAKTDLNQGELDELYKKAKDNISNVSFKAKLKPFDACIPMFDKSNIVGYYTSIRPYDLNSSRIKYQGDDYLGYKKIIPAETFRVIQAMRNSYLHFAEAKGEQNGVVWYLFNFLVWLGKKEYPNFFKDEKYIGSNIAKELFKKK